MHRLTGEEFGRLFDEFRSSAFRLETLQYYATDEDKFAAWQRGEDPPLDDDTLAWDATIKAARDRGARFERVRIVVEPIADYVRWELGAYRPGEDVRILTAKSTHPSIGHDFWLFDSQLAVLMEYDSDGRFIAGRATRSASNLRLARAELTAVSIPLADYLTGAHT